MSGPPGNADGSSIPAAVAAVAIARGASSAPVPQPRAARLTETSFVKREEWSPPKEGHEQDAQERFRRAAREHVSKPAPAELLQPEAPTIYAGSADVIAERAGLAVTHTTFNPRQGKYFDAVEGPRESMAVGRRPSVRDMLKARRGGVFGADSAL